MVCDWLLELRPLDVVFAFLYNSYGSSQPRAAFVVGCEERAVSHSKHRCSEIKCIALALSTAVLRSFVLLVCHVRQQL